MNWTNDFPLAEVAPLAKVTSDHSPCKIIINTGFPRSNLFRFENFWVEHGGFLIVVENSWSHQGHHANSTNNLATKFKKLRYALKSRSKAQTPVDWEPEARTITRPRAEAEGMLGLGPVLGRKVCASAPEGCSPRVPK